MRKVACIGAGMTLFRRRLQETPKEMCWEAARMALDQARLEEVKVQNLLSRHALH